MKQILKQILKKLQIKSHLTQGLLFPTNRGKRISSIKTLIKLLKRVNDVFTTENKNVLSLQKAK